jgi:hypothetical protein
MRKEGVLEPVGEISMRLECILDSQKWKFKTLKMLKMRDRQLEKLLEECQNISHVPGQVDQKVYIRSSLSERPTSNKYSYYEPS